MCDTPPRGNYSRQIPVKFATSLGKLMKVPYMQCFDFQGVWLCKLQLYAQESRKGHLKRFKEAKFQKISRAVQPGWTLMTHSAHTSSAPPSQTSFDTALSSWNFYHEMDIFSSQFLSSLKQASLQYIPLKKDFRLKLAFLKMIKSFPFQDFPAKMEM